LVENVDGPLRSHDGDFSGRPREVDVRPNVFARHHAVRSAIRLTRDNGHLRDRCFRERIEQLRAVTDDSAVLLTRAGKETRHVLEGDQRYVESVAEAYEARTLDRGIDVKCACEICGLIRDDAHRSSAEPCESDYEIAREVPMHLQKRAIVKDGMYE